MEELMYRFDFDPMIRGNLCLPVEFVLPQDPAYLLTDAEIYMDWRKNPGQTIANRFSSDGKGITITGDYKFIFDSQIIRVPADSYRYDILIVFKRYGNSEPETLIYGTVPVVSPITEYRS
jgi:hypothetical protein